MDEKVTPIDATARVSSAIDSGLAAFVLLARFHGVAADPGTIAGSLTTVSGDAATDEHLGLVCPSRIKLSRTSMRVVMCFSALLLGTDGLAADSDTATWTFVLQRGANEAVCRAYLERLNGTHFSVTPLCDRPEDAQVQGFSHLQRETIPPEALHEIYEGLIGFAHFGDSQFFDKQRVRRLTNCDDPKARIVCNEVRAEKAAAESQGVRWGEPLSLATLRQGQTFAWKYRPPIDIDNDGRPDPIVFFRSGRCGGVTPTGYVDLAATYAYVMDDKYERVDEMRTRQTFGHPFPNWPGVDVPAFRYIGVQFGVFSYKGQNYFDTFFSSRSDFGNERIDNKDLPVTLGVFHRKDGRTSQICEYLLKN